ncbi:MAG: hypothetical protein ACPH5G_10245, partial [Pseudooceanicola atlanticus]
MSRQTGPTNRKARATRGLATTPSFIWPINIPAGGTATRPQDAAQNIACGPARGRSAWQRPTLP